MEPIEVTMTDEKFDEAVHGTDDNPVLPQFGNRLQFAAKANATVDGNPGVCISFDTRTPDGKVHRVQAVTTMRNFQSAAMIFRESPLLR